MLKQLSNQPKEKGEAYNNIREFDIENDCTRDSETLRKSVTNLVADSDHKPDADIENDVAVPDI